MSVAAVNECYGQQIAVKTNLLYDSTLSMDLGVEVGLSHSLTLDVPLNYNPWTFADNRKMKMLYAQPALRLWTCEKFNGHFFGLHLHGGIYNFGGMLPWGFRTGRMFGSEECPTFNDYRHQGWFAGAGLSYGYQWVLGRRWGLEAEIGAGYAYIDYTKYPCEHCGEKIAEGHKHYLGPTKAAVTLIYFIR